MEDKKEKLLAAAKELFSKQGFKATNVSQITKAAGIATGTFYLYFTSKEQIFMDIFLEENVKQKKELHKSFDVDGDPLTAIQNNMAANIAAMQANPILREWFNHEVFKKIEDKYREENGLDRMDFAYDYFYKIIETWQEQGKMRKDIPADMIMAIFTAMIVIDEKKDQIGFQFFPKIQDYLAEFIMMGLTDFSKEE
jgi:AcrR family transcriptional regulator